MLEKDVIVRIALNIYRVRFLCNSLSNLHVSYGSSCTCFILRFVFQLKTVQCGNVCGCNETTVYITEYIINFSNVS